MSAPLIRYVVVGDHFVSPLTLFRGDVVQVHTMKGMLAASPGKKFSETVAVASRAHPTATFIFIAGNNDAQTEIYRKAAFSGLAAKDFTRAVMTDAFKWVKLVHELPIKNPSIICFAMPPTVDDAYVVDSLNFYMGNKSNRDATITVGKWVEANPEIIKLAARSAVVDVWNRSVAVACRNTAILPNRQIVSCDLASGLTNENGLIAKQFFHLTRINQTLLWEPTIDVWQQRLGLTDADLRDPRDISGYMVTKQHQLEQLRLASHWPSGSPKITWGYAAIVDREKQEGEKQEGEKQEGITV